jgi:hypothetical protein
MPCYLTYETITPESADHGDSADRGYYMPGGWRYSAGTAGDRAQYGLTLRDAIREVGCLEDCGTWYTEADGTPDYRTGAHERKSLHLPENITPASAARVHRILKRERLI